MPNAVFAKSNLHFRVSAANLNAHLFQVTLTIKQPAASQRVSLPVWIPGSYLVREFAKNLQRLSARQGKKIVAAQQIDKASWQLDCDVKKPLVLSYEVYALDNSVRTAWLDASRGFFNGTSLFLRVDGQADAPHDVQIAVSPGMKSWKVATALLPVKIDARGFGTYRATHYDELVDCPVEMGNFWSGSFTAYGVPHRFVVAGATDSFDGARLLADTQKICEAEIRFWHGDAPPADSAKPAKSAKRGQTGEAANVANTLPIKHYLFMLNAVDDGYGGLEHRNSTALICRRQDLPRAPARRLLEGVQAKQADGYTTLLGLISHEYFHTWNVKRLRPVEFAAYDYAQENYTELLWFFEGFTSYFDDRILRLAGLVDDVAYLKLLSKNINQVLQTPGRLVQSVAQASFDAWVKYYRQDENTPNATVSYYSKGALVALCLDLSLRQASTGPSASVATGLAKAAGATTLDAVMRALWLHCKGGPMQEADLLAVLQILTARSWARELASWVHSTDELPLKPLLEGIGLNVLEEPAQWAQALGLRAVEAGSAGASIQVKTVLRGGAAEAAGFASGDEWLGLELGTGKSACAWRLARLDELPFYAGAATQVRALVARDKRLLKLPLTIPKAEKTWRLTVRDPAALKAWFLP